MKTHELLSELNYNKPIPNKVTTKVYVDKGARGAKEEKDFDMQTGGFVPTGKWFVWRRLPVKDEHGNIKMVTPHGAAHFRPATVDDGPNIGEPTRGGKAGLGDIFGAVGEWLEHMGAERSDIAPALKLVRASNEYQDLLAIGFDDITNKVEAGNGTLTFKARAGELIGDSGEEKLREIVRRVLADGKIRGMPHRTSGHGWRAQAHHPMTIKTHPDLTPVERIAGTMRKSIAQLIKVYKPMLMAAAKKRLSQEK